VEAPPTPCSTLTSSSDAGLGSGTVVERPVGVVYICVMEAGVGSTPERAAMPILRLQVRPEDWERKEWRESFEADLKKTGWFIQFIESPSRERRGSVHYL